MAVRTADNDHGGRERLIDDRVLRLARNEQCPYSDVGVVLLVPRQDLSDGAALSLVRRRVSRREGMQGNHTAPAKLRLSEGEVECHRGRGLPIECHDNRSHIGRSPTPCAGDDHHRAVGLVRLPERPPARSAADQRG